jgi:N-acetylmuramoyl-L-alanine amidase
MQRHAMVSGMSRARRIVVTAAAALAVAAPLAGCGSSAPVTPSNTASTSAADDAPAPDSPGGTVQSLRRMVLLDPGHNGGNGSAPAIINRQVPDGRGGTKACNTVGTSTDSGYPEHKFTWDVARRVAATLQRNGVNIAYTRDSDKGAGPCVDARGEMAEKVGADVSVSIHADGAAPTANGFHVAYSAPPLSQSQERPSILLATEVRDAMRSAGLLSSTYIGKEGLSPRKDLAGLNLSRRPAVLVECANMRNPEEALMVASSVGRQRIADAIASGVLQYLRGDG